LDTLAALVFAVALSIALLVVRVARGPLRRLGELPGGGYARLDIIPEARAEPAILVVRLDAELFFANAEALVDGVVATIEVEPLIRAVVLDLQSTNELDVPSADALAALVDRLSSRGIRLALSHVHAPVRDMLRRTGITDLVGANLIVGRVEAAVRVLRSAG
jgi:anti-anti-sigma factor